MIVAAEPSSCLYANLLLDLFKVKKTPIQCFGVGDKLMESKGFERFGRSEDMAVMGIFEVIKHLRPIAKVFRRLLDEVDRKKPKAALLLDYPGFNLRLAKALKAKGIPVYYYISPQIWAWKKNRIHNIKKSVDKMLVILPFEEDFYKRQGMKAHYVGHPLCEVMAPALDEAASLKPSFQLGLMPGSRVSEVQKNLPVQLKAAEILTKKDPDFRVSVLKAPSLSRSWLLEQICKNSSLDVTLLEQEPTKMILQNEAMLVASGTATLQVAFCERPQVAMYRMNGGTAWLAKKVVRDISYFCLVNIIADKECVPEFFQDQADPQTLAHEIGKCLYDQSFRNEMLSTFRLLKNQMGRDGATKKVFGHLMEAFDNSL